MTATPGNEREPMSWWSKPRCSVATLSMSRSMTRGAYSAFVIGAVLGAAVCTREKAVAARRRFVSFVKFILCSVI